MMRKDTQDAKTCRWQLHVLGCRGSRPVCGSEYSEFGGATSCYLLQKGGHAVLLDCGTGLYQAKELLRGCRQIDILLSHVHYDHMLGLLAGTIFPADAEVRFIAPFDNWLGKDTLRRFFAPPFWPHIPGQGKTVCVDMGKKMALSESLSLRFCPGHHPNGGCMLRLETEDGALCYVGDYEHAGPFPEELARGCSLLIYDAMFTPEEYAGRIGWGHSTWREGCELARRLDIPKLLLVHHDPERTDAALRAMEAQAKALLPAACFARSGDSFMLSGTVPFVSCGVEQASAAYDHTR